MKVIVGLGNPGPKYAGTRHNVGFDVIDYLAAAPGCTPFREKFEALVAEAKEGDETVLLVKPLTFMNLSGRAVRAIADFYKVPVEKFWLFATTSTCRSANCGFGPRAATAGRTGYGTFRSSWAPMPTPGCGSGWDNRRWARRWTSCYRSSSPENEQRWKTRWRTPHLPPWCGSAAAREAAMNRFNGGDEKETRRPRRSRNRTTRRPTRVDERRSRTD